MGSVLGWVSDAANAIEEVAKVQRRTAARPAPVRRSKPTRSPAAALGLSGENVFAPAMQQSRERVRHAAARLPNPPTAREVARGYDNALTDVFEHQPRAVQQRIVQRALTQPSADGDVILSHLSGLRGEQLRARRDQLARVAPWLERSRSSSPFDAAGKWVGGAARDLAGAVGEGLTPFGADEVGSALGDPSRYLRSTAAFAHPQVAQMAALQGVLAGTSKTLTGLIDRGEQAGLLGDGQGALWAGDRAGADRSQRAARRGEHAGGGDPVDRPARLAAARRPSRHGGQNGALRLRRAAPTPRPDAAGPSAGHGVDDRRSDPGRVDERRRGRSPRRDEMGID